MNLKQPFIRAEIVSCVGYLAEIVRSHPEVNRFSDALHALYDDYDLSESATEAVGYTLYDISEAELIIQLIQSLTGVLEQYGYNRREAEYKSTPEWKSVKRNAVLAYEALQQKDSEVDSI